MHVKCFCFTFSKVWFFVGSLLSSQRLALHTYTPCRCFPYLGIFNIFKFISFVVVAVSECACSCNCSSCFSHHRRCLDKIILVQPDLVSLLYKMLGVHALLLLVNNIKKLARVDFLTPSLWSCWPEGWQVLIALLSIFSFYFIFLLVLFINNKISHKADSLVTAWHLMRCEGMPVRMWSYKVRQRQPVMTCSALFR